MLSVRRCRELVGKECRLNDEELDVLRTQFYALARITFTEFENRANPRVGQSVHNFTKALPCLSIERTPKKALSFDSPFIV